MENVKENLIRSVTLYFCTGHRIGCVRSESMIKLYDKVHLTSEPWDFRIQPRRTFIHPSMEIEATSNWIIHCPERSDRSSLSRARANGGGRGVILAIKMSVSLIQTNVLLNRNRLNCHVYFIYIKDTCLHVSERLYVFDISRGRTKTDDSPCRHAVHAVQTVKIAPTTVARIVNLRVCLNFRHTCFFLCPVWGERKQCRKNWLDEERHEMKCLSKPWDCQSVLPSWSLF